MITKAANEFASSILQRAEEQKGLAAIYANAYAQGDGPADKVAFHKAASMEAFYRKLHGEVCRCLHDVEAEMIERQTGGAA